MKLFPINLDLAGRRVLVIGGGPVASRKAKALRDCGAAVTVVSPAFCAGLSRMKRIRRIRRGYRQTDLRGAFLVISAAGPAAVNQRAWRQASAAGIPINVVDQPDLCSFTVPAVMRRGDLTIAIATGGGSPALSGQIRVLLEEVIGPEYAEHLRLLKEMRAKVRSSGLSVAERGRLLKEMASPEIRAVIKREGLPQARVLLRRRFEQAQQAAREP